MDREPNIQVWHKKERMGR